MKATSRPSREGMAGPRRGRCRPTQLPLFGQGPGPTCCSNQHWGLRELARRVPPVRKASRPGLGAGRSAPSRQGRWQPASSAGSASKRSGPQEVITCVLGTYRRAGPAHRAYPLTRLFTGRGGDERSSKHIPNLSTSGEGKGVCLSALRGSCLE